MTYLLDVNILVALIDPNHFGHEGSAPLVRGGRQQSLGDLPYDRKQRDPDRR